MRDNAAYFLDMLIAARKIHKFVEGLTEEEFRLSELHQSAVVRELQILGEAARLVSETGKQAHPEIEWEKIAGMRNRLVHEYFRINLRIVWQTAATDVKVLIQQLEKVVPPPE